MKVLLVNSSMDEHDGLERALQEVALGLKEGGVVGEIYWLGSTPIRGCMDCGKCTRLQGCIFDDAVKRFLPLLPDTDGFVFGAPAHWRRIDSQLIEFMDQMFYWESRKNAPSQLAHKPAFAVAATARGGSCSFSNMKKFFDARLMPIVGAPQVNMVRGRTPAEVEADASGLDAMCKLGRAMARELRVSSTERAHGVNVPEPVSFNPNERIL